METYNLCKLLMDNKTIEHHIVVMNIFNISYIKCKNIKAICQQLLNSVIFKYKVIPVTMITVCM